MKKTIISLAVAAGMAASSAAFAEATVYGVLHVSLDSPDTGDVFTTNDFTIPSPVVTAVKNSDSITMSSQTSAIGVKGSEDLGDGVKAFYQAEFQVDITEAGPLTGRDQFVGLHGGMGTVKFGTMSSNWKQTGATVDPMYRTALEGRGEMQTQSSQLHGGAGRTRGRMTDLVQYSSPKMGGMQLVVNTTFDAANTTGGEDIDETMGVGIRYEAKDFSFFADMIDISAASGATTVVSESAIKVGGTFTAGPVKLALQHEMTEDLGKVTGASSDYTHFSADYTIDANNSVYLTVGQRGDLGDGTDSLSDSGSTSVAVMYDHKMSSATDLYVGYGVRSDDDNALAITGATTATLTDDYSVITAGMRVKF